MSLLMRVRRIMPVLALALALSGSVSGWAARFHFEQYRAGLRNLNVNAIQQDHDGYLWVGTENGLYRFDGVRFREYGPHDGVTGHFVENLFLSRDGRLWVGTTQGVFYRRQDGSFVQVHGSAGDTTLNMGWGTMFAELGPGDMVVETRNLGIVRLRQQGDASWRAEPLQGLKENGPGAMKGVAVDHAGVLWFGCDLDLCQWRDGQVSHVSGQYHLQPDMWTQILVTRDGHIWLRGSSQLVEIDPLRGAELRHPPDNVANASVTLGLAEDNEGRILLTRGLEVDRWNGNAWDQVQLPQSSSSLYISAVYVDRQGSVWLGEVAHGLVRWVESSAWEEFTTREGLSGDIVWSTVRDRQGRLWIGTDHGLDWMAAGSTEPQHYALEATRNHLVYCVAEADDGAIWVALAGGNVVRVDVDRHLAREFTTPEVGRMQMDGAHRLWMSSSAGLYVVNTNSASQQPTLVNTPVFGDAAMSVNNVSLGAEGRVWLATDRGLFCLGATGWRAVHSQLDNVHVGEVAEDGSGHLWVAGGFPGLMYMSVNGDRATTLKSVTRPPLVSEQVNSLLVDSRGWLWVGQDAGLSVFDGSHWSNFTEQDGLVWNDTNSDALMEDRDGTIWLGTTGGLAHLLRPAVRASGPPAAPVFSEVDFGEREIAPDAHVKWTGAAVRFELGVLDFREDRHLLLRYRLLGLEDGWTDTEQMELRYPRLDPGRYRLQVKMVDAATGGESPETSFSFTVTPLWWQSLVVRVVAAILVCLLLIALWLWRMRIVLNQKRDLELAVAARTLELEKEKSELLRTREQIRYEAEHDALTQLWNRRMILKLLAQEVDRSQREKTQLALLLIDLDHFKQINDTLGHPAGDMALQLVGEAFRQLVRPYDAVGRYGGEEFLLVLPGCDLATARERAETIRQAIGNVRFSWGLETVTLAASVGVAAGYPDDTNTLILAADARLYAAKQGGRNRVEAAEIPAASR